MIKRVVTGLRGSTFFSRDVVLTTKPGDLLPGLPRAARPSGRFGRNVRQGPGTSGKRIVDEGRLTGDARPRFFKSWTLCSRSRCGAREAMTVGCKPTKGRPSSRLKAYKSIRSVSCVYVYLSYRKPSRLCRYNLPIFDAPLGAM